MSSSEENKRFYEMEIDPTTEELDVAAISNMLRRPGI
jgi:hypothetical protein